MDNSAVYSFSLLEDPQIQCLGNSETKEQLLQYNLDKSLQVFRFRFVGNISNNSASDYDQLCKDFFASSCFSALQCTGSPSLPLDYQFTQLGTNVMNMDFFDRITESGIAGESGTIRGCFDETFDGILISDQLREVLLNPDSERASLYNTDERNEFIYNLFRLFVVGGALCQPDSNLNRYLNITKAFYKDLITIYKEAKTDKVTISGRIFKITSISGVELFPNSPGNMHNTLILLVDPLKKTLTVIKNSFLPFW